MHYKLQINICSNKFRDDRESNPESGSLERQDISRYNKLKL